MNASNNDYWVRLNLPHSGAHHQMHRLSIHVACGQLPVARRRRDEWRLRQRSGDGTARLDVAARQHALLLANERREAEQFSLFVLLGFVRLSWETSTQENLTPEASDRPETRLELLTIISSIRFSPHFLISSTGTGTTGTTGTTSATSSATAQER